MVIRYLRVCSGCVRVRGCENLRRRFRGVARSPRSVPSGTAQQPQSAAAGGAVIAILGRQDGALVSPPPTNVTSSQQASSPLPWAAAGLGLRLVRRPRPLILLGRPGPLRTAGPISLGSVHPEALSEAFVGSLCLFLDISKIERSQPASRRSQAATRTNSKQGAS